MRVTTILGNTQRLDGGAMFGNCPKALWQTWSPPDEQNRIDLACRCLLVEEDSGRKVLLEAGVGAFFPPKLRERFGVVEERHVLLDNLKARGISPEDIDVVVLSHLHFDHAGGVLSAWRENEALSLVFPRATYVVGEGAWQRALHPHSRDRASFIAELQPLLEATGRLERVTGPRSQILGEGYSLHESHGHTPGLMLTEVETPKGPLLFVSDLIPGAPWVHLPITMGYDRFPELLIEEKRELLDHLRKRGGWLVFTHDPHVAAAQVQLDEKGRYQAGEPLGELDWQF